MSNHQTTTVVVHSLGTLSYLGQSAIFKTAKKSVTWDTGHGTLSDFGGILARRRRDFLKLCVSAMAGFVKKNV